MGMLHKRLVPAGLAAAAVAAAIAGAHTPAPADAHGTRVVVPCAREDLSGSTFPCRWDVATRGSHRGGDSFTVYPLGQRVGNVQEVVIRYDAGAVIIADVTR